MLLIRLGSLGRPDAVAAGGLLAHQRGKMRSEEKFALFGGVVPYFTFNPMLLPARRVRPGHSPRPPVPRVRRVHLPVRAPQLRAVPPGQKRGVQRPLPIDCRPTGQRERRRSWNKGNFFKKSFML